MSYPSKFRNRQMQDLRLGIKSSFNNIRNAVALLYCIYLACGKKAKCNYGVPDGNVQKLSEDISNWLINYFPNEDVIQLANTSKLITSQIEAMQVCFELVFGLARISFNSSATNLSERTGGNRYPKRVLFSANMLILHNIIASHNTDDIKAFLLSWLKNEKSATNIDDKVCDFLTLQTEKCVLKMRFKNREDLFFQQEGIYEILAKGDTSVEISDDEKVGTFRVLNSFISEGLHSYLTIKSGEIKLRDGISSEDLKNYLEEVSISLDFSENRQLTETTFVQNTYSTKDLSSEVIQVDTSLPNYLRAMRTKPFLLLAGISGTGKSRIVKQMAFDSCPDIKLLREDKTTPGNYCLVEVKPNWHDSSELMGYESQIGHPHYVTTTFVRFLAKAMLFEEQQVPFFVCLDEMNLAPVEQYFAEFLSVLESRKLVDGKITSEALIPADIFKSYDLNLAADLFGVKRKSATYPGVSSNMTSVSLSQEQTAIFEKLKKNGLRIPSNLIVIGTVNMDETTHQFSRKVIDRAMTIEMNLPEDEPFMDFFNNARDLEYTDNPTSHELFLPTLVKAADVVTELEAEDSQKTSDLKTKVATILTELNEALNDTPFKIAYRVQNELMLYFHELWLEDKSRDWNEILRDSVDQILMMKVLPRVEGDEDLLEKPLESLATFCATGNYTNAANKVEEMQKRLNRAHFTSYWP